jgi:hypothetical protein
MNRVAPLTLAARAAPALLGAAAAGIALAAFRDGQAALRAWYFGALVGLHISLGCAALLFMGDLAGGRWNQQLEPLLNAGRLTIPWMLPLVVAPLFWIEEIFPWTTLHADAAELADPGGDAYLSPGAFAFRAAVYLVVFLGLAFAAGRSAAAIRRRRDKGAAPSSPWSSAGFVLYAFANLFFQADAVMSLEPEWHSTAFPLIMMSSQVLAAYSLCLFCRGALARPGRVEGAFLGNLLLAMMLFWLYVAFAQFLIIWMGNLAGEISYYLHRSNSFWIAVSAALAVFSFAVPFLLLLRREIKNNSAPLGWVALLLFVGQLVFLAWAVLPSWSPLTWPRGALCALAALGFAALWLWRVLPRLSSEETHG